MFDGKVECSRMVYETATTRIFLDYDGCCILLVVMSDKTET